ncbi:hypothetical protein CEXT_88501 [Caerostris extrusa]|uniref:Uncharacterized protein n=1 Tax=Caerostris extrusa TaxID=172846 RepID=A0AAV4WSV4_CAEEX|nr:hypothetical protein CEXT_88501 [Caerostris extrusa]
MFEPPIPPLLLSTPSLPDPNNNTALKCESKSNCSDPDGRKEKKEAVEESVASSPDPDAGQGLPSSIIGDSFFLQKPSLYTFSLFYLAKKPRGSIDDVTF